LTNIIIIATFWYSQKEIIDELKKKLFNMYPVDMCRFFMAG